MAKADFMAYVKNFLKAVTDKLTARGKADRIDEFKKGCTEFVKFVISKYSEFQFYTGPSYNMEAGIALSY